MIRMTVLAVALLYAAPGTGAERSVALGMGTEKLLYSVEDPDAFLAYRQRLAERRGRALSIRAEIAAARPPRGVFAIPAMPNPVLHHRRVMVARIQRQRKLVEQQERVARAQADRLRAQVHAWEALARAFAP